jgi:putative ABC transport system substrate-binding protein
MRRREFITLLGGATATWPLAARAQQAKPPRIGFLGLAFERTAGEWLRAGLRDLRYIEGTNIIIEWQWAQNVDELPALAAELVRMHVDVIFAPSSTFVEAARQATTTIPIVFAVHADPVGLGHVAGLARPGGNVTGTSMLPPSSPIPWQRAR